MDVKPIDGDKWRLELSGLIADKHPWTVSEIDALFLPS
jgi:DMSO/TMAO reductase YedYZ molybdopterin-dependent catalytic subunit